METRDGGAQARIEVVKLGRSKYRQMADLDMENGGEELNMSRILAWSTAEWVVVTFPELEKARRGD